MGTTLRSLRRLTRLVMPRLLRDALDGYRLIKQQVGEHDRRLRNLSHILLVSQYPAIAQSVQFKDGINAHGFKCFSQNNEDGILLYLFSKIGVINRRFVEFGVQDGRQCNTANLSLNFGWSGLLMEADARHVEAAKKFYQDMMGVSAVNARIIQGFVTAENIDMLLLENNLKGEIDLLSIDIDGNDYWVWKAISAVTPSVAVIEYNAAFGADRSVTIPYDPSFSVHGRDPSGVFYGASLTALTKLAAQKGYVLVGCDSNGVNAFFVRRELAEGKLPEVPVCDAYFPNARCLLRGLTPDKLFDGVKHLPFQTV